MLSPDTVPNPADTRWAETVMPGEETLPRGSVAVRQSDLDAAVLAGVISRDAAQALWLRWTAPDLAAARAAPSQRGATPLPVPAASGGGVSPMALVLGMLVAAVVAAALTVLLRR